MIQYIKRKIVAFLERYGFVRKNERWEEIKIRYYELVKERAFSDTINKDIISVVFSKDRAMQLDAFLMSYFENVQNTSSVKVIYKASNESHRISYEDLKNIYKDKPVTFIEEVNFREQLITLLDNEKAGRVIFYVDDMLFTRKIDYNVLKEIDPLKDIVALSRGKDLVYSTVLAKKLEVPTLKSLGNGLYRFRWNEIKEFSDWTYPVGVSGYMFSTKEILEMMKAIAFKAPNSLEGNLQVFNPYFMDRGGVCFENVVSPCIHANITQTEGYNNILGDYSLEDLLKLWNERKRIDYKEYQGLPCSVAETKKYSFIDRE